MTDCFQPKESVKRVTYKTIKLLNKKQIHYLIVTKNDLITRKEYLKILNPKLAHIQISIPHTDDKILSFTDNAPSFKRRAEAVETLFDKGFDVSVRLSPFLYKYMDYNKINNINCDKILIEFLRFNEKMKKDLSPLINSNDFKIKANNYRHLPLMTKIHFIKKINFKEMSVCETVDNHHYYFKEHINHNPHDCCNLRLN